MPEEESTAAARVPASINFDQPVFPAAVQPSALRCSSCSSVPSPQYFELHGTVFCASCATRIQEGRSAFGAQRFGKAFVFGAGAALVCGAVYAAIVYYSGFNVGLLAIALGFAVGKAVFVGSSRVGGWKYQALAMVLTYFGSCMRYIPYLMGASAAKGALWAHVIMYLGVSLIAPFLILLKTGEGFIGLLILSFGIYEAWKINRRRPSDLNGPFDSAPAPVQAIIL